MITTHGAERLNRMSNAELLDIWRAIYTIGAEDDEKLRRECRIDTDDERRAAIEFILDVEASSDASSWWNEPSDAL